MDILTLPKHHAVLIAHPSRKEASLSLWKDIELLSRSNIFQDHTVFDIEIARNLISWAHTPHTGEKMALLSFHSITHQAQNALLKVVEEPPQSVRFILVTTNKESLLPTLRSRLEEFTYEHSNVEAKDNYAETFLTTAPTERMDIPFIKKLLTKTDEEGRKDRESIKNLILTIAEEAKKKSNLQPYILPILTIASYAGDSSSSGKALLEYLSLLLPKAKD